MSEATCEVCGSWTALRYVAGRFVCSDPDRCERRQQAMAEADALLDDER